MEVMRFQDIPQIHFSNVYKEGNLCLLCFHSFMVVLKKRLLLTEDKVYESIHLVVKMKPEH